jgi:hypothetical protein
MTPKQDRVGARTVQDLERRINIKKVREDIEANTKLVIESGIQEAGGDIISYINASADKISLKGNRLEVDSTNFKLSPDGEIEAKSGTIGGFDIGAIDDKYGGIKAVSLSRRSELQLRNDGVIVSTSDSGGRSLLIEDGALESTGEFLGRSYIAGGDIYLYKGTSEGGTITVDDKAGLTGYVLVGQVYLLFRGGIFVGASTTAPTDLSPISISN